MSTFNIIIDGVTPLLLNKFTDAAAMAATNGTRTAQVGTPLSAREDAESRLYISEATGNPMIPGPNLYRAIIEAGKFHKNGKSKITTQKSSIVPSAVSMKDVEIALEYKDSWTVDTRAVRIPATGGRILRHRPLFADWRLSFELDLDETILSPVMLRQLVDDAGSKIGLGDFRPDTKGPFGKFKVVLWENLDEVRPRKRRAGLGKAGRGQARLG